MIFVFVIFIELKIDKDVHAAPNKINNFVFVAIIVKANLKIHDVL